MAEHVLRLRSRVARREHFRRRGGACGTLSGTMIACLTHWSTAGLYASPVVLIGSWLFYSSRRDRRRDDRDGGPTDSTAPPAPLAS